MKAFLVQVERCDTIVVAAESVIAAMHAALDFQNKECDEDDERLTLEHIDNVTLLADFAGVASPLAGEWCLDSL